MIKKKYSIIIFIILLSAAIVSCNNIKKKEHNVNRVEIILSDKDDNENIKIQNYNEDMLKKLALSSLKEFYSLPYNENSVRIAYEKFYSTNYKEILRKTRNINNADDYVESNPSLDFEFQTRIDKVYNIELDGQKAYIDADSYVYDRVEDTASKTRQTFVMSYENNRWVIL